MTVRDTRDYISSNGVPLAGICLLMPEALLVAYVDEIEI